MRELIIKCVFFAKNILFSSF